MHLDLSPSSQSLVLKFYFPLKGCWTPWKNDCFQVWFRKGMRGSWWILHQKNKNILKNWKGNVKKDIRTAWKSPICQIWDNLSIKKSSETVTTMNYNTLSLIHLINTKKQTMLKKERIYMNMTNFIKSKYFFKYLTKRFSIKMVLR